MKSWLYIPFALLLTSCDFNSLQPAESASDNQTDSVQPIITTPSSDTTFPGFFEVAFDSGTAAKQGRMKYTFSVLNLGKINVESGKIIACDPVNMHVGIPFTPVFPVGEFPVELALAKSDHDLRVALARIVFSDSSVVRWEFALKPGQMPVKLIDSTIYCYSVDAGQGLFIDSVANIDFPQADWEPVFIDKSMESNYTGFIHAFGSHNLAAFSTGYGDGCYCTYIGYDSSGNICRLLTDFGLVQWWNLEISL